jgi:hypothetical protein
MGSLHLKALQNSVEQACQIPASFQWDRKAAAYADLERARGRG